MAKEYVKNYLSEIKEIKESLSKIESVIAKLPDSSWKFSMSVSTTNFNKKVDAFLAGKEELSTEQKEAIRLIKSGKIPAFSAIVEKPVDETPTATEPVKKGKKY